MNDITNGNVHSSQTNSSQASSSQSLNDDANKQQRDHHRIKFTKWLADDCIEASIGASIGATKN